LPSGAFYKAEEEWKTDIKALLSDKVKLSPNKVTGVCNNIFFGAAVIPEGVDLSDTYCDELCVHFGSDEQIINQVGYVGSDVEAISGKIRDEALKLSKLVSEQKECQAAERALKEFRVEYDKLNGAIKSAQNVRMAADSALEEASDKYEAMMEDKEDKEDKVQTAETALEQAGQLTAEKKKVFDDLKKQESDTKLALGVLIQTFTEAGELIDQALAAIQSFDELKLLVTATVRNMWNYFDEGVLQPLDKLGLQKNMELHDYFEEEYDQIAEWEDLTYDLKDLQQHCTSTAKKAFGRVKKEELKATLLDMCAFDEPAVSAKQFGETVVSIGQEMKTHLETAQTWHKPLFDHAQKKIKFTDTDIEGFANAGEIPMLRDIEPAFSASAYYDAYLQKWKANGPFLELLKQLGKILAELEATANNLKKQMEEKTALIKNLVAAKKKAYPELQKAIADMNAAQGDLNLAREEDEALQDQIDQAEADLEALRLAAEAAYQAYVKAKDTFKEQYELATAV